MKIIKNITYSLLLCWSMTVSSQSNTFDFPILIKKTDDNFQNINIDSIQSYKIDSVLIKSVNSSCLYFKFLVGEDKVKNKYFKVFNDDNESISISIDFEGYSYAKVEGEIYLVLNPYLGCYFSVFNEKTNEELSSIMISYKDVFNILKNGEVILNSSYCDFPIFQIENLIR